MSRTCWKPASRAAWRYSSTTDTTSAGAKLWRSIASSIGTLTGASSSTVDCPTGLLTARLLTELLTADCRLLTVFSRYPGRDAAARGEIADHGHAARRAGLDQVVKNLVGDRLIENSLVTELEQIVFERLELDAARVGDVTDADHTEVGQSRLWTHRRELGTVDRDLELALGAWVRKGLECRRCGHASSVRQILFSPAPRGKKP